MRPHVVQWLEAALPPGIASAVAPSWFTCVGLAGVVSLILLLAIARRHRIDAGVVASIVLWCYVAAVVAGIAVPIALDAAQQLVTGGRIHLRWAGMTSFWGYLAGGVAVAAVCRAHEVPLARFADLASAPMGVALVFARMGCFLAGCDYGKVTSVPWAIRFPAGSPAWHDQVRAGLVPAERAASLPVHPTQLYEAATGAVIVAVVLYAARTRWAHRRDGRVFLLATAVYAISRIIIEGFRGDAGRGIYLGLSSGQIFSVTVLAAITAGWWVRRPRLPGAIATAALALAAVAPHPAAAQPASPSRAAPLPPPAPPGPPPAGQPEEPYGPASQPPGAVPPMPSPYPDAGPPSTTTSSAAPAATAPRAAASPRRSTLQVGALLGLAAPVNRRRDQVAPLGGASLSLGVVLGWLGMWLDLDSLGNRDASHGTVLLSGGMTAPVAHHLQIGGRIGVGATLVNFDDPAFRDVAGTTVRFEALVEYGLGDSWVLWLRPLSFDTLVAADLGGPITTWQLRIGVGYRFAVGRRAASAPPPRTADRTGAR